MKPPMVLVSGAPGAGKTTLARALGDALFLPVVLKDAFKESLARVRPPATNRQASMVVGYNSFVALHRVVAAHLDGEIGLVLEAAFIRGFSEDELRPNIERAAAVNVHCVCDPEVAVARYAARFERGERHPVHAEREVVDSMRAGDWGHERYDRMDLGIPTLDVDTTDGWTPAIETVVAWIEEQC